VYKFPAKTLFVGKKLVFLTSCHSTNEKAYDIMSSGGLPDGSVVITDHQTKGRGQMGNPWEAEAGKNLTFSIILKPIFLSVAEQFRLNQAISLGILDALCELTTGFSVKWPNDIYFNDRKVGGILIQNVLSGRKIDYSIVGIGINVNQQNFQEPKAISLSNICDREIPLSEIFTAIISAVELRYLMLRNGAHARLHSDYINQLYRFGEDHLFKSEDVFSGRIIDVRPAGELVVETRSGLMDFRFKEVEFI